MRFTKLFCGPFMIAAGVNHFANPKVYEQIMPDYLPAHRELVYASGVTELAGGLLTLHPKTKRAGGWILLATLVGVTPAHIHMLQHPERYPKVPKAGLWARLPIQVAMLWWVYSETLKD